MYTYVYIHIYIYIYMFICMYVYIYIYIEREREILPFSSGTPTVYSGPGVALELGREDFAGLGYCRSC